MEDNERKNVPIVEEDLSHFNSFPTEQGPYCQHQPSHLQALFIINEGATPTRCRAFGFSGLSEKRQVLYASMWIWSSNIRARQYFLTRIIMNFT